MLKRRRKIKAVILDRDGTLNKDTRYINKPEDFTLYRDTPRALKRLSEAGFKLFIISNQSGIARGYFKKKDLNAITKKMKDELKNYGVKFEKILYCTHHPDENCNCRKPKTGLFNKLKKEYNFDMENTYYIGNWDTDTKFAKNCKIKSILVRNKPKKIKPDYTAKNLKQAVDIILSFSC